MNRAVPVIFIALTLLLSACSPKETQAPKKDSFELSTVITYSGNEYSADIYASSADVFRIKFTSPEQIKDLCFAWETSQGYVEYKNLKYSFSQENTPELFVKLHSAFKTVFSPSAATTENSDGTYTVLNDDIEILLNESGTPLKISIPGIEVTAQSKLES